MRHISELQKLVHENLNWNRARISYLAQILQASILVRTVNLSHFSFDRTAIIPIVLALFNLDKDLVLILDRRNWKWGKKGCYTTNFLSCTEIVSSSI